MKPKPLLLALAITLPLAAQQDSRLAWAPVPTAPATWVAPNRPLWKLADLLAQHKGQANWTQTVVSDSLLHADYISMAPGAKTPRRFRADTRDYGIGLQILKDLGLARVRLLTNNPKKTDAFVYYGYELKVVDQVPIVAPEVAERRRYLDAKRDKLGHLLPQRSCC